MRYTMLKAFYEVTFSFTRYKKIDMCKACREKDSSFILSSKRLLFLVPVCGITLQEEFVELLNKVMAIKEQHSKPKITQRIHAFLSETKGEV